MGWNMLQLNKVRKGPWLKLHDESDREKQFKSSRWKWETWCLGSQKHICLWYTRLSGDHYCYLKVLITSMKQVKTKNLKTRTLKVKKYFKPNFNQCMSFYFNDQLLLTANFRLPLYKVWGYKPGSRPCKLGGRRSGRSQWRRRCNPWPSGSGRNLCPPGRSRRQQPEE